MKSALYLTGRQVSDYKGYLAQDGVSQPFDRLVLHSIDWQLSGGASTDNQYSMNKWGKYHKNSQPGSSRVTFTLTDMYSVNGGTRKTYQTHDWEYRNFRHINDVVDGSVVFNPPLVFEDAIVGFTANQNMVHMTGDNSNGNSISYIWFNATATSSENTPSGSLSVPAVVEAGTKPTIGWTVNLSSGGTLTNPPIIGGPGYTAEGDGNNGHGNNADGVDGSNPGSWQERGITDPSGDVDDEIR